MTNKNKSKKKWNINIINRLNFRLLHVFIHNHITSDRLLYVIIQSGAWGCDVFHHSSLQKTVTSSCPTLYDVIINIQYYCVFLGWIGLVLIVYFCINAGYGGTRLGACWAILEERYPEYRSPVRNPYATIAYRAVGRWGRYTDSLTSITSSIIKHLISVKSYQHHIYFWCLDTSVLFFHTNPCIVSCYLFIFVETYCTFLYKCGW
jgi:hypothetical protein